MPFPPLGVLADRSAGYAFPPLGVPADLQSAVKKCPNLFMLWGFAISVAPDMPVPRSVAPDMPFPPLGVPADLQSVRSAGYAFPPLGVPADLQS